jgi:homoserine O-acetyltransferase
MTKIHTSPLGEIETQYYTFGDNGENGLLLDCGRRFGPITVAYETYGKLNSARDNTILICHALSGDAHAAGISPEDGRLGWWEILIGPGKAFNTDKYFVICSNVLGGCKGTTGPASINPATGQPYALSFPVITINDMVRVQRQLLDHLGVERLLTVAGGSMGGMQVLSWAALYPEMVVSAMPIATAPALTAQGIAWDEIGRRAIMADADWDNGSYYAPNHPRPRKGLAVARMVGHITYLSEPSMEIKFGRRLRNKDEYEYGFGIEFEVESYLDHQGEIFNNRFDANSYLYITRAMDYFDFTDGTGDLENAFQKTTASFLILSFSSDWLYPPEQSQKMAKALKAKQRTVYYFNIEAPFGHDSFLLDSKEQTPLIESFLNTIALTRSIK